MKKWTEDKAISWLKRTSDVEFAYKNIFVGKNRLSGLTACSAFDYLKNHCGYIAIIAD